MLLLLFTMLFLFTMLLLLFDTACQHAFEVPLFLRLLLEVLRNSRFITSLITMSDPYKRLFQLRAKFFLIFLEESLRVENYI